MNISLENYLRDKLQENEEMHDYAVATETLRCWIDEYNNLVKIEPKLSDNILSSNEFYEIFKNSFGVAINLSDFFEYACADMILIEIKDLYWILPIYEKYGYYGLYAAVSFIAKKNPITPHMNNTFKEAYSEIEKLNPKVYSEY